MVEGSLNIKEEDAKYLLVIIIIIIFHETHAAYRLWRGYIHFGIETLCCPVVSPVSCQTFCRRPPHVLI